MDDLFGDDAWGEEPDWVKLGADHRSNNTEGGQQEENDGTASPMVLGAQHVLLLVDCHADMFSSIENKDDDDDGDGDDDDDGNNDVNRISCPAGLALRLAQQLLQQRIRDTVTLKIGKRNGVGVLLFDTKPLHDVTDNEKTGETTRNGHDEDMDDDDDDDDDDAASEVNKDQQDEFLPQAGGEHFSTSSSERRKTPSTTKDDQKSSAEEVKVNDVEVLANERTKGDLGLLPLAVVEDDEKPTEDEDTEISDDYEEEDENSEASEKLSTMAAPLEEPNKDHDTGSNDDESTTSKYDDDDDDDDHDPQASDAVLLDLQDDNPTSSAAGEQAPTKIDERVPPAPPSSNLSTSMGSPTTTISSHSTKIDLDDDGEGSVNKLRSMFDSPTVDGEKPRRSWRPKKTTGVQQQMPSIPSDDDDATGAVLLEETSLQNETKKKKKTEEEENPHPTVTMKVQQGTGASRQSSVVTLHQAVMTSSVQDIEGRLVALVSLFPESMYEYLPKQNRALLIFQAFGLVESIIYVDGSNPAERDRRNELFELSGKRGSYPQLFVRNDHTGQLEFFADFDKIELLNDCQTLKEEIEKAITIRR